VVHNKRENWARRFWLQSFHELKLTIPPHGIISPGGAGKAISGLKECQQVGVELVLVRDREAVGCARVDLQGRVLDELR
jgi:hypothetical protein